MPLSASTCLRGAYCIAKEEVSVDRPKTDAGISPRRVEASVQAVTVGGIGKMSTSDLSEYELHRKALSLGLLLGREGGSMVSGLNLQAPASTRLPHTSAQESAERSPRHHGLPGISGLGEGSSAVLTQRSQPLPKPVALPKIPSIKHPLEGRAPQILQREGSVVVAPCGPSLTLTSQLMTPRSKTTLDPSTFVGRRSRPGGSTGTRWANPHHHAPSDRPSNYRDPDPRLVDSTRRLVISPKSKADLRHSPKDFYHRKFPHVHLDLDPSKAGQPTAGKNYRSLGGKGSSNNNSNNNSSNNNTSNQTQKGVTDTISTTKELFALTRSKTDLMGVEQLIQRSTDRIKSTRSWGVSTWMNGMTCNPKKLHRRDLTDWVK